MPIINFTNPIHVVVALVLVLLCAFLAYQSGLLPDSARCVHSIEKEYGKSSANVCTSHSPVSSPKMILKSGAQNSESA